MPRRLELQDRCEREGGRRSIAREGLPWRHPLVNGFNKSHEYSSSATHPVNRINLDIKPPCSKPPAPGRCPSRKFPGRPLRRFQRSLPIFIANSRNPLTTPNSGVAV